MKTTPAQVIASIAPRLRGSCGGGRVHITTFDNGVVRATVRLDRVTAQKRAIADGLVYTALSAAGIPCQVVVQ